MSQERQLLQEATLLYSQPEMKKVVSGTRILEIRREIAETGSYWQTSEELKVGAMLAWRNHARCLGRRHWQALELIDARHMSDSADIADQCFEHLARSTNRGRVRPTITVFSPVRHKGRSLRIVNPQLIRYAGYQQSDGTVIGDPQHIVLTEYARALGWHGDGTAYDVLPVIIDHPMQGMSWYEVPPEVVLEVKIGHPGYPKIAELGMRWHANPAISNMCLSVGGIEYTAAPFSGWYVSSEIGARNLSDIDRYNYLPAVASAMGLDFSSDSTLWKDRALVELNYAVLYSFEKAGVRVMDHHFAAKLFMEHIDKEAQQGRTVPASWMWMNSPISSSTLPTFTERFAPPQLDMRPNFVDQQMDMRCPFSHSDRQDPGPHGGGQPDFIPLAETSSNG